MLLLATATKLGAASGLEPLRETSMRRPGPLPHSIAAKLGAPGLAPTPVKVFLAGFFDAFFHYRMEA